MSPRYQRTGICYFAQRYYVPRVRARLQLALHNLPGYSWAGDCD